MAALDSTAGLSLAAPPAAALMVPGIHDGIWRLGPPRPLWRPVRGARVAAVLASDNPFVRSAWRKERRANRNARRLPFRIELGAQLAVAEDVAFTQNFCSVNGRWFLNGSGGSRLWTHYLRSQRNIFGAETTRTALLDHFAAAKGTPQTIPAFDGDAARLPFVLDARNLFNYYHFMAETFCNLALLSEQSGFKGDVMIHCPDQSPKAFVAKFAEALFPELAPRIQFPGTDQRYERALTPFTPNFYVFQAPTEATEELRAALPASKHWEWAHPAGSTRRTLKQNGYSRALALLRARALAAIKGHDFSHLPRRFWFGRRSDGYRDRTIPAEETIIAALRKRSFDVLYFEDLSPLEQIAAMHRAEMVVSYHGAGFTNLLYAGSRTHVVELGTLQSATLRWADFQSLAHVAGCRYTLAICDGDVPINSKRPKLRGTLHKVDISQSGIATLLEHIEKALG